MTPSINLSNREFVRLHIDTSDPILKEAVTRLDAAIGANEGLARELHDVTEELVELYNED